MQRSASAEIAIVAWIESHIGISNMEIWFDGAGEALVADGNGGTLNLRYDSERREVYAT